MLKVTAVSLAVVALLAAGGLAWAHYGGHAAGDGRTGWVVDRVTSRLELDAVQREKLQVLVDAVQAARIDARERRSGMREEARALLESTMLDRDRAQGLVDLGQASLVGHLRELVDPFADFTDSLTPEQREELVAMIDRRLERRWGHAH